MAIADAAPDEILRMIDADPTFAAAWSSFAPSHRREWSGWVGEAKKPETRVRRTETVRVQVLEKSKNHK